MSHGKGEDLVAEMMPAFISEVNEQIESIEGLLLQLEDQAGDPQLLDALFRCAHTIKGSAGVFGIEPVVEFTHHVETVLDGLRDGTLQSTPALSTLLLECNDAIRTMVNSPDDAQSAQAIGSRRELVERLHAVSGTAGTPAADSEAVVDGAPAAAPAAAGVRWRISVRFLADTFRHGMDPLSILNYLAGKGRVVSLECDRGAIPALDAFDPESCHLAFRFEFHTVEPRERIEHAFGFVREDCELELSALDGEAAARAAADAVPAAPDTGATPTSPHPAAAWPTAGGQGPSAAAGTAAGSGTGTAAAAIDDGGYIRIPARRLDEVITLLGELVIAGAGNSQLARQARQRALIESSQQMSRLIEGIRNSTLKLRMVPIGDTFTRFRRTVRDTAASLGKEVLFEVQGGETELDKAMVERIADPLMHLVRNALDHGLETPQERREAGKPAQGRLTLSACHESGSVLIRIIDDGRGIRRRKVLERAWERGLVERGVVPPDNEILALIFEPGFSTAEQVTNLSGRGVGMDVVRSNIESLRGSVAIDSVEGAGSTIEIRLPLTLAIIDGFLVCVGDSNFIFPLDTVVEVIASNRMAELDEHGRGCVTLRGSLLPVIDLRTLYALEGDAPANGSIVVVRIGARRFGVMVDSLLGQHQTVIKPLGQLLRSLRGISGSSILGTGEVALIFDVDALGRIAVERRAVNERDRATDLSSNGRQSTLRQGSTS